ncbi:MAG: methyltransferase domain-containing protein [Phycisphaerales bacterium]|nr:methyltransferase domain-containing protein [Phycisphaerales bacterium]
MIGLSARHLVSERMDDPALDPQQHRAALRGLARINRCSRTVPVIWSRLEPWLRDSDHVVRVLDLATGGGDLAIGLAERAQRCGRPLQMIAGDISPTACAHTAERAAAAGVTIDTAVFDALRDAWPDDIDIVVNSLFLHHLNEDDVVHILQRAAACARLGGVVSDLRRTRRGYVLAAAGVRLLSRSPIVHDDGPQSVRAAFTTEELRALVERAGIPHATVRSTFPQRHLITWRRR